MVDGSAGSFHKYVVSCFHCRNPFDAIDSPFCSCIDKNRTLVCPSCLQCFCAAPSAYKLQFWSNAPQDLWKRRLDKPDYEPQLLPAGMRYPRPLVLLVEDEKEIRAVAAMVIESLGYGMIVAKDGAEGLALARQHKPDLVITDALMPKLDGRKMCQQIKADPDLQGTRVVIISSVFTRNRYKTEAIREFRADDFLPKPIDFNTLREVMQRLTVSGG